MVFRNKSGSEIRVTHSPFCIGGSSDALRIVGDLVTRKGRRQHLEVNAPRFLAEQRLSQLVQTHRLQLVAVA
jgi:hypothetical protein